MPYFYGVYPADEGLSVFLGMMRFIMQPDAIRFAHITLRGPYERKLERTRLDFYNEIVRRHSRVRLDEPATFFGDNQNTVVLGVNINELRTVWYKPRYPMGDAHITLYDGDNRRGAILLYEILSQYNWHMRFRVSDLRLLEPKLSERDGFLKFTSNIYRAYEKCHDGRLPPLGDVHRLKIDDRLSIIQEILPRVGLPAIENKKKIFA
jgi:hypothetical protein